MNYIDINSYHGFIYETTNQINRMKYIGQCRFDRINGWRNYLGSGTHMKRAIKKYGAEHFSRRILFLAIDQEELDELEVQCIEAYKAVESGMYYNLKKTAKGGDTFTTNPRKEETRKLLQKIRSGKGNSQYGKPKTEKMIQSVKKANSKKIIVEGIIYNSLTECANKLTIGLTTLCFRLRSDYQPNYLYLDDEEKPIKKQLKKWKHAPKKIVVDGIKYDSIGECARALNTHSSAISTRLKSPNFPYYQYL
ncbi:TPA: hypothetical protein ROX82_000546 [Bacillus thuringiensis]|uniref:hypothetical protein n=1 Tax=Bacillus cereus TaxID=1396 RepID=UPI00288DA032|nr:hypothetical protein [Bacillus thuringiensis]HDX9513438.1 hypothetical protein [Bacillus thuringiensis]